MKTRRRRIALGVAAAATTILVFVAAGAAFGPPGLHLTNVPTANVRSDGVAPAAKLSRELQQIVWAQGSTKLENPSTLTSYYGYDNDTLNAGGQPKMVPTPTAPNTGMEAHKTEPDKNTYLVFKRGLGGPDPSYDYGTHFLFQGHEGGPADPAGGPGNLGYITRINLDADTAHRVTLYPTTASNGKPVITIDGSTWDPWANKLLFTTENQNGPTYLVDATWPSTIEDISGSLGRGGYEGIQNDSDGNLWIDEDIGSPTNKPAPAVSAKFPNSFVFRFVPTSPGDLKHGKLQALQVLNESNQPITFESQSPPSSPDQIALHTYGKVFTTNWITVHDTTVDGTTAFNANLAAKAVHATPFKRPENGLFRPGSHFREYYFDETGDTNAASSENACCGGWGSVFKIAQSDPSADSGHITIFYKADGAHAAFDNTSFLSKDEITFVQDQGEGLHGVAGFDSGFVLDVNADYSNPANQPVRWLAQGRDASATLDAANGGFGKNDQDNEITGTTVSDGNPGKQGVLGARVPHLFKDGWRFFYTQQHGDNVTYEVIPSSWKDYGKGD
jgi:hypothetical protein